MKYILLCGGMNSKEQKNFDKPRHLLEIKGESKIVIRADCSSPFSDEG